MAQIEVTEESLRTAVDEAVFAQAVTLADKVAGFSAVGPQNAGQWPNYSAAKKLGNTS